jgi:histidyl-tRNA synthetase
MASNFQAVKGTRDFYPETMRLRNHIMDAWRRVSLRCGFEEYDAPIFEYLDLFTVKSGDEIAEQLFSFTDRGGRDLAIRPEITPSLARMVADKINALPRPIKWFSMPRLCRAEKPQRGRLREFFQWNVDIIGVDDVLADAECIFTCVELLRELGLTTNDLKIRIGSRPLWSAVMDSLNIPDDRRDATLALVDKRFKMPPEDFEKLLAESFLSDEQTAVISDLLTHENVTCEQLLADYSGRVNIGEVVEELKTLLGYLKGYGIADWCVLDLRIVRGLAYYTGVVYEAIADGERAVAGGGRYDNLLQVVGGPAESATGFGMGDVVLGLLLQEKGLLPDDLAVGSLDFFVIDAADGVFPQVLEMVATLRQGGLSADCHTKRQNVGKQLKQADKRGARCAVLLREGDIQIKQMASGSEQDIPLDAFMKQPGSYLPQKYES